MMERDFPDFEHLGAAKPGAWFRRRTEGAFYNTIVFTSSQKRSSIEVDLYCGLLPDWDGQYGTHQLRAALGLANLRFKSGSVPLDRVSYKYDGSEAGVEGALKKVSQDLRRYALPWFSRFEEAARKDRMVQFGMKWIRDHWGQIAPDVMEQIDHELGQAGFRRHRTEHAALNSLEADLRSHAESVSATRDEKRGISLLALDLLRYTGHLKTSQPGRDAPEW